MTPETHTVRQWQSRYQAGAFEGRNPEDSFKAGWLRYSCRFDALPGRLRQMAPLVTRIQASFLLDHYNIWFENIRRPNRKAVYAASGFNLWTPGERAFRSMLISKIRTSRISGLCTQSVLAPRPRSIAAPALWKWPGISTAWPMN